jgi:hypothetical protein
MHFIGRLAIASLLLLPLGAVSADDDDHPRKEPNHKNRPAKAFPATITVFAPADGDVSGVGSAGTLVDLAVEFAGDLASTGASLELTGGGAHANADPFPGTFGFGADKDHFPGLVVLFSSTLVRAGPGQNLADLFNIITVTNRTPTLTEIWATWIVGAKNAFGLEGQMTPSTLFVGVVEGTAPDVVEDKNGDGKFDNRDLKLMGYRPLAKGVEVDFVIHGS